MSDTFALLPADVRAAIRPHLDADASDDMLAQIGVQIASKRQEAREARTSSGIETTWRECEDAYGGIDDANRHEKRGHSWEKAQTKDGPLRSDQVPGNSHRSTIFVGLTSRYVDAGVAKLVEILLPADKRAFSFKEMPVPQLIEASDDMSQVVHDKLGVPLTRPIRPGETPPPAPPEPPPAPAQLPNTAPGTAVVPAAQPGTIAAPSPMPSALPPAALPTPPAPQRVPLTVRDLAIEKIELARKQASAAETRVYDWMIQTQYPAEVRKVIGDAARIGVGVLKAPTPRAKRVMAITQAKGGGVDLHIREDIIPASVWVSPWNIFPDPACGESIQEGDYVFERDHMSARQVRGLKKLPGYIHSAIDQVIAEGPNKANLTTEGRAPSKTTNASRYEVWYFYGTLTGEEMDAINRAAGKEPHDYAEPAEECHVIVTLINDCVVRATINPLDSGSFPYHSMPWQRRADSWAGVGVAEQMQTAQKVTNAALRGLLNNAGKSSGAQVVVDRASIRPADGEWTLTPDKIWYKSEDGASDVRQAFTMFNIPNITEQMLQIIQLGERFAEETTSIPLIAQGQSGATTPDTFGATQIQNNNANQLLRTIGYAFDDYITEPVIRQYYEWLLLDPTVPNEEKGEFQVDAHGSAALVEQAIQDQSIAQMGAMAASPIYGIDPRKWAKLYIQSKRLPPDALLYSKEEQAKLDAAPPPEAPQVTVAKINADAKMKLLAAGQTAEERTAANETQIAMAANALEGGKVQNESAKVAAEQERTRVQATVDLHRIQSEHELALMQYANAHQISIADAKVQLAKTAMQLQTERELHAANLHASERTQRRDQAHQRAQKPPVQVPGRAANGHAFDQAGPPG